MFPPVKHVGRMNQLQASKGAGNCHVTSSWSLTYDLLISSLSLDLLFTLWLGECILKEMNLFGKIMLSLTSFHFIWGNTYLIPAVCWNLRHYPWAAVNLAENKAYKWKYTENSHSWVREGSLASTWRVSTFKEQNRWTIAPMENQPRGDTHWAETLVPPCQRFFLVPLCLVGFKIDRVFTDRTKCRAVAITSKENGFGQSHPNWILLLNFAVALLKWGLHPVLKLQYKTSLDCKHLIQDTMSISLIFHLLVLCLPRVVIQCLSYWASSAQSGDQIVLVSREYYFTKRAGPGWSVRQKRQENSKS